MRRGTCSRPAALALCLAIASGASCSTFRAATPEGFVVLPDQRAAGYDYRATTADGLVLAVRAIANEPRGDRAFWGKAIVNRLRTMGGYALLAERPVRCATGLEGTAYRFGHDESGKPHLYDVALFVTDDEIFVLEAGGARPLFEANAAKVDAFVSGFRPR
jgi:hypothetical protein